ncbi:hypothetical protein [Homoserinimonas sp. A520]
MTTTPADQQRRTRRLALLVGGALPLMIAVVTTVLMIGWLPELPDPIAVHWSGAGPDGFGPAWPMVLLPGGLTLLYAAFAVGAAWKTLESGLLTWNQKFVLATGLWLSALLSIGIGGSIEARGLDDAREAADIGWLMLAGALAGLVLAVGAWFILPKTGRVDIPADEPEPLTLAPGERVSWSRSVRLSRRVIIFVSGIVLITVATAVFTAVAAPQALGFALASLIVVTLLTLMTSWWTVTADRRGLRVVSVFGWPRMVIPLSEIAEVNAVQVSPTAEFGGWGWRLDGAGRTGIIMRTGSAVQVTRASGKKFVVTVDDADTAASVLAALIGSRTDRLK